MYRGRRCGSDGSFQRSVHKQSAACSSILTPFPRGLWACFDRLLVLQGPLAIDPQRLLTYFNGVLQFGQGYFAALHRLLLLVFRAILTIQCCKRAGWGSGARTRSLRPRRWSQVSTQAICLPVASRPCLTVACDDSVQIRPQVHGPAVLQLLLPL